MTRAPLLARLAVAPAILLAGPAAHSQSLEAANAAFAAGRFVKAAELAETLKTSEGYALAAKSLVIHGHHVAQDDKKRDWFRRAMDLAAEAVRADPRSADARLQLARAMGRYTQTMGIMEALGEGYAVKLRDTIKEALRLSPNMAAAHVSLGAWHAQARHRGGFMAGLLFGASWESALDHYGKALELAPDDTAVLIEYARGLLLIDRDANRRQARALLARATRMPAEDAYGRLVRQAAVRQLAALDARPAPAPRHPGRLGR